MLCDRFSQIIRYDLRCFSIQVSQFQCFDRDIDIDNDAVFSNQELQAVYRRTFDEEMKNLCEKPRGIRTSLHLVTCTHAGLPTWAQNDAMLEAYIDHVDYFYRINDDTKYVDRSFTG